MHLLREGRQQSGNREGAREGQLKKNSKSFSVRFRDVREEVSRRRASRWVANGALKGKRRTGGMAQWFDALAPLRGDSRAGDSAELRRERRSERWSN